MDYELQNYSGANNPVTYELWNECADPDYKVESLMWGMAPIDGKLLLDVGAGSGFQAVRYAEKAFRVFALEPDPKMLRQIYLRLGKHDVSNVSVLTASVEEITLPRQSIDVAYARFAYFDGTENCLPGLREIQRLLKPEGHLFVIAADPDKSAYGEMARTTYPNVFHKDHTKEHTAFYSKHGFQRHSVDTVIRAPDIQTLKEMLAMDFPDGLNNVKDKEITYSLSVYHYQSEPA